MLHELEFAAPMVAAPPPKLHNEEIRETLDYRVSIYRLLSGVFIEEPSAEFIAALRQPESLEGLAEAGLQFDADFLTTESTALVDQLAAEYATLFAASGGFPPIESVRLTGRLKQDPFFAVQQLYAKNGFCVGGTRFYVFDDQLGVELAFAAELLERCATAFDAGDEAAYRDLDRELKRFWTVHLGKWVRGYAGLVQRAAEHSLYREMARLLEAFANEEIALLRLRIEDADQGRAVVPKSEIKIAFDPNEPVCGACESNPQAQAGAR
jgi:TorA maturation chaperone TorD